MADVVCEICGTTFYKTPYNARTFRHHYCSKKCMGKALRKEGLWQNHECLNCGQHIVAAGGHYRKYCSLECAHIARRVDGAKWRDGEQIKEYMRLYVRVHRERLSAQQKEHNRLNPQLNHERQRRYRITHREQIAVSGHRRRTLVRSMQLTAAEWDEIKANYGYRCAKCQKQEPRIKLEMDHIIPLSRGGEHSRGNIQPLCRSCNATKQTRTIRYRLC